MSPARIRIVEDEALVARDLTRRLIRLGYSIPAVAASGAGANHHALTLRPDVVLMDIHLRGTMDGLEAAQAIRAQLPMPIVYLSAYIDAATAARIQETGATGYLRKPVAEHILHITLRQVLSPHSSASFKR
jgi:DNA-binding NarL/FixJ family response regulator